MSLRAKTNELKRRMSEAFQGGGREGYRKAEGIREDDGPREDCHTSGPRFFSRI